MRRPVAYARAEHEVGAIKVSIAEKTSPHRFDTPGIAGFHTRTVQNLDGKRALRARGYPTEFWPIWDFSRIKFHGLISLARSKRGKAIRYGTAN
jgi:hypothetical protein